MASGVKEIEPNFTKLGITRKSEHVFFIDARLEDGQHVDAAIYHLDHYMVSGSGMFGKALKIVSIAPASGVLRTGKALNATFSGYYVVLGIR